MGFRGVAKNKAQYLGGKKKPLSEPVLGQVMVATTKKSTEFTFKWGDLSIQQNINNGTKKKVIVW